MSGARLASEKPQDTSWGALALTKRSGWTTLWTGLRTRLVQTAIASVLLIVATLFFPVAWFVLVPLMFLAWIYAACVLAYRKMSVHYHLTTQRFIHKSGILRRTADRLEVIDIDDVTYSQGLIERMVNVGSIRISSSDRTHPELVLIGIENVQVVSDTIDDVRRKERRRRGLHIEAV